MRDRELSGDGVRFSCAASCYAYGSRPRLLLEARGGRPGRII
jgi:hypothetical protein